jgi:hypothetical protein
MESKKLMTFGKYKGTPLDQLPADYVLWLQVNCCVKKASFAKDLVFERRYMCIPLESIEHSYKQRVSVGVNTAFTERKTDNGSFVMQMQYMGETVYYLIDQTGNYVRDLQVITGLFGRGAKCGALDTLEHDWVTLDPNGKRMRGKLLISPYWEHFAWETFQDVKERV